MMLNLSTRPLWLAATLAVSTLWAGPVGLHLGTDLVLGNQATYLLPGFGLHLTKRFDKKLGPFEMGWMAGADVHLGNTAVSNNATVALVSLPLAAMAHVDLVPEGTLILRPGLAVGPMVSLLMQGVRFSPGVTPFAQARVEIGARLTGGGEILLTPYYDAIFEMVNPGGTYVHSAGIRLGVNFKP